MTAEQLRILVADDDPVIRTLLSDLLAAKGYVVAVARNGDECLACLETTPPDLLFLDLQMPGTSGVDVLNRIKQKGNPRKFAIFLFSADTAASVLLDSLGVEVDYCLAKPFTLEDIEQALILFHKGRGFYRKS